MWRKVALERYHGDPPMRSQSATTLMGSKVYVFGGLGSGASNNLWALDTVMHRWQRLLPPKGTSAPPARSGAGMCADEESNMLYLFGGLGHVRRGVKKSREGVPGAMMRVRMLVQRETFSDVWEFDATKGEWEYITFVQMAPPPRRGHTVSFVSGRRLAEVGEEDANARPDDALSATGSFSIAGGDTNDGTASHGEKTDEEKAISVKLNGLAEEETPKYIVTIGGAGPDPKGFENVLGQPIWTLDLLTKRWFHLPTTGCVDAAARFEHTTTKIGDTLWVIGGMTLPYCEVTSDPNQDITQPTVTTSSLKWGNVLHDIASLDLETLVWSRLEYDGPQHPIHGHTACESPTTPGEILIVGGYERVKKRHAMARRNTVNALLPKPGLGLGGHGKDAHGESQASLTSQVSDQLCAEDLEDTVTIKSIRVTDEMPVIRKLPTRGQPPPPSYGHICVAWNANKLSMSKLRRDRGAELEERGIQVPGGAKKHVRRQSSGGQPAREEKKAAAASGAGHAGKIAGVSAQALVNQGACLLFYGGARTKRIGPEAIKPNGFSTSELYLYDCLWAPPDSESEADPEEEERPQFPFEKRETLVPDRLETTDKGHLPGMIPIPGVDDPFGFNAPPQSGGLSFAPSLVSGDAGGAGAQGPGGNTPTSRAAKQKSEADLRFFLDQLELNGGELPGGYDAMKQIILQRRPDHTTSKLRRGERVPKVPPWLSQSALGHSTSARSLGTTHGGVGPHTGGRPRTSFENDMPHATDSTRLGTAGPTPTLARVSTAPAGLGRPSLSANTTQLDPLDARSTVLTRRPSTSHMPRPLPKHDLRNVASQTLKRIPKDSTIWRARDLFQFDVVQASYSRPRTNFEA